MEMQHQLQVIVGPEEAVIPKTIMPKTQSRNVWENVDLAGPLNPTFNLTKEGMKFGYGVVKIERAC
eukprot:3761699-Amphidinium_carterae.1